MLVQGFGRQGRRKEGEAVLDETLNLGFIPNIAAYNRLLDTLHMGRSLQLQENFSRHVMLQTESRWGDLRNRRIFLKHVKAPN